MFWIGLIKYFFVPSLLSGNKGVVTHIKPFTKKGSSDLVMVAVASLSLLGDRQWCSRVV